MDCAFTPPHTPAPIVPTGSSLTCCLPAWETGFQPHGASQGISCDQKKKQTNTRTHQIVLTLFASQDGFIAITNLLYCIQLTEQVEKSISTLAFQGRTYGLWKMFTWPGFTNLVSQLCSVQPNPIMVLVCVNCRH